MKAIIFGAGGQDGHYLNDVLLRAGIKVVAVSRRTGYKHIDISNFQEVLDLVGNEKPGYIFHLAANSTTRHDAIFENHQTISTGTLNIMEAVRTKAPACRVFISGSGLQFKNTGNPISETDEFEARDPYSVSRIQSVYASRYFRSFGLKIYVGYFFNHESPLRTERHMTRKISEAAKRIKAGSREQLTIGDISVVKEYTYAGDAVEAVWQLVNQEKIFEANIGSGTGYSIRDWLDACFGLVNIDWGPHVTESDNFTPDYKSLVCDPTVIHSLGWKPQVSFDELAKMMMK